MTDFRSSSGGGADAYRDPSELAGLAGRHLDLVQAPFTLPRSRVLVFRADRAELADRIGDEEAVDPAPATALRVHTSEYERWLDDCRVIDELVVRGADGVALPVTRVLPHVIEFGGGAATLTFAGPGVLGIAGVGSSVEWTVPDGARTRVELTAEAPAVRLHVGADRSVRHEASAAPDDDLVATERLWIDWFAKCPIVRSDLQQMAAFCWWVLGANIVELPSIGEARGVVPSKIGYVGVWQWDAYFIAVGLRHGDPALAREQLEIAFRFPGDDGQLPDVVHEEGVLASSDDLPAGDRDRLRRAGSQIADPNAPVPLTKPPLAAWALAKVLEVEDAPDWARAQLETIRRSQDWWFAGSDLDGDGMPEYGHPYSSGLDDSPIFDGPLPTTAPDLGAYLVLQDLELARLAERYGTDAAGDPRAHRDRAARTLELLLGMWHPESGRFLARAAGETVGSDAIVGFMPLLTGGLPQPVVDALIAALADPARYGLSWTVPTVSAADPDFSSERMWRGPVWVNTNTLIIEGLRASGHPELARDLAERTVALVVNAGGPHEYFNPTSGRKARTATTAFGWSAALFIDLAVGLSAPSVEPLPVELLPVE
ncbi:glycogen debranching protein [Agromyces fucosus]|uniref:Glycogen debranching protein n=1 Tax=Agromyces fucosus TaxID=41985 RepID=A0A4Q2JY50_9MICO|nr:glycogen debranching protein [Agromyces fucosus]RXZ51178.1 glycogen debranching protein [Agromyces fucosus]